MNASHESLTNRNANKKWRTVLFSLGVVAAVLSAAAGVCSWVDPFPLLSDGRGGYRLNPLEGRVLIAGLSTGFVTMTLGAFGKRVGRVLLIVIGLLLIVFNMSGWLGNHR
jgi:hypothetical protein